MYKMILLLQGRADLASGELTQLWRLLPWAGEGRPGSTARHLHNRAIPGAMPIKSAPAATFDAIDEFWFADEASARDYFESRAFRDF